MQGFLHGLARSDPAAHDQGRESSAGAGVWHGGGAGRSGSAGGRRAGQAEARARLPRSQEAARGSKRRRQDSGAGPGMRRMRMQHQPDMADAGAVLRAAGRPRRQLQPLGYSPSSGARTEGGAASGRPLRAGGVGSLRCGNQEGQRGRLRAFLDDAAGEQGPSTGAGAGWTSDSRDAGDGVWEQHSGPEGTPSSRARPVGSAEDGERLGAGSEGSGGGGCPALSDEAAESAGDSGAEAAELRRFVASERLAPDEASTPPAA